MDYLKAIERPSVIILLNGKELRVGRAVLGLHFRLSVIQDQWREAKEGRDYKRMVALTFEYIASATGLDIEWEEVRLLEVMAAFIALQALNRPMDDLPFMQMRAREGEYGYDYENRALANWVARLAGHYSWTADYVLNELMPEEAACYMQEAIIQDYEDKEFLYRLSEVAYKVEGTGKSARAKYVPFPKPSWMDRKIPKIMVPKTWMPQGNVIEAGDIGGPTGNA